MKSTLVAAIQIGRNAFLHFSLTIMCILVCWQLISQTTWWAATGLVLLNMTSWPQWRRLPKVFWPAATTSSNRSLLTTTSMTTCPGSGTSTSRKTGKTKRGLCVWGARESKSSCPLHFLSRSPHPHPVSTISALFVFTSLCISCSHALVPTSLS